MKKKISAVVALMMVFLMLTPVFAQEAAAGKQSFDGIWADSGFDKMELMIFPSESTWFDERMGKEASAQKYVIRMVWPSSDSEESIYSIVAELDETGTKLTYEGGMLAEYTYDENGDVDEENTSLTEDNGTGFFSLSEDGVLYWHDSCLTDADNMTLRKEIAEAPSAEDILASYYLAAAGLETGTAGASLKLAETVLNILVFCQNNPFWCMDQEAFSANLKAAQEQLTGENKAAYEQNRSELTREITRLLKEDEEAGSVYADAGVEKQVEELRNSPDVRISMEILLSAAEGLN